MKPSKFLKLIKSILLFAIVLSNKNLIGQVIPNIDWVKYFSEKNQIANVPSAIDANNNVYVTGYTYFSGTPDITTLKYDASGVLLWSVHYNNGGTDKANAITLDQSGNIYVTGFSDGTTSGSDYVTIKYDVNGNQIWSSRYNGVGNSADISNTIAVDASGSTFVTGKSTNLNGNTDYVTIKYNSSGVQQWANTFNGTGNGNDEGIAIGLGSGNRLFVTGNSKSLSSQNDITTLRLNSNTGAIAWTKSANGSANNNDRVYSLLADGNDVVVCGSILNNSTSDDYLILKYNGNNGNTIWQNTYNGFGYYDAATAIIKDATNNYLVTGLSFDNLKYEYHTIKFNSNGVQQWINRFNTNSSFFSVTPKIATDNIANHYYVCGEKINSNTDITVYQITPSGNTTWNESFNGANNGQDAAVDLTVNSQGVVYVAGSSYNSNAKFDYTTIRISQTPVYFPPDFNSEPNDKTMPFNENLGQVINTDLLPETNVKFYTTNQVPNTFFQKTSLSFLFSKMDSITNNIDTLHRIDLNFEKSNELTKTYPYEQLNAFQNYYSGYQDGDITNVRGFQRLLTPNIYPNIDLHYYTNKDGLKYYFVVKPGANPSLIKHLFNGATSSGINNNQLEVNSSIGKLKLDRPIVYQVNFAMQIVPLSGNASWQQLSTSSYGFTLPTYNPSLPLIIEVKKADIPIASIAAAQGLCWSSYFGGSSYEASYALAKDELGNQYMGGNTASPFFPTTPSAIQANIVGDFTGFYSRFDANNALTYSTFFGGNGGTTVFDIKCKNPNQVMIAGYTYGNNLSMQSLAGAYFDGTSNGALGTYNAFMALFDNNGNRTYGTYLSGTQARSIEFDSNNNLYVVGTAGSTFVLQNLSGAYNQAHAGGADGFILKFDNSYNLVWGTCLGGSNLDNINAIKLDNLDNLYLFGDTKSTNLPTVNTVGGYLDNSIGGTWDNFCAKFSSSGQQLWTTYFGGASDEQYYSTGINNIATANGSVYFIGGTQSADFPTNNSQSASFFDNTLSTNSFIATATGDGYLVEFDQTSLALNWSTYISGDGASQFFAIDADNNGNIYIGGHTSDHTIPIVSFSGAYNQSVFYGGSGPFMSSSSQEEAILFKFNPSRSLEWSTLFGGYNDHPYGEKILDLFCLNDELYITGLTAAHNNLGFAQFPLIDPGNGTYFDNTFNGSFHDAFISKFCPPPVVSVKNNYKSSAENIKIYPNPSSNYITVSSNEKENSKYSLSIYTIGGQKIYESNYNSSETTGIDVSKFSSGMYFIQINNKDNVKTAKFIKE